MSAYNENMIRKAVEEAEEIGDPFDGLIERTRTDPGAPFAPDVLEALTILRTKDFGAYETWRARLKKVGCRLSELDARTAPKQSRDAGQGVSQADMLVELAEAASLFHTSDGTSYADLKVGGHRETWPIRSRDFRNWLLQSFYEATRRAPNSEAIKQALDLIGARARFEGPVRPVFTRVGEYDGKIYLDLGDEAWRAVEITPHGWRVIDRPPIRFRRSRSQGALPPPVPGGSIELLRPFLRTRSEDEFVLAVSWLLASLRPAGPYLLLVLAGEQGSAKSTVSRILRSLVDPAGAALRSLPREERDLFIAASSNHVLVFDNISGLSSWLSDALCRLSTGGGFACRQLYTDQDETILEAIRPVILNGIEDFVTRSDLVSRSLLLTLAPIPEESRRTERELQAAFERDRPRILGALLDGVVEGLRRLPNVRLARHPRMADFARWGVACETAFWPEGTFEKAYSRNRDEAIAGTIEADPLAEAVCCIMHDRREWKGSATELLAVLADATDEGQRKANGWPRNGRALSGRLRRAAPALRRIGIQIEFGREGHNSTRTVYLSHASAEDGDLASAPSASSVAVPDVGGTPADMSPIMPTQMPDEDAAASPVVRASHQEPAGADDADAKIRPLSAPGKEWPFSVDNRTSEVVTPASSARRIVRL